MNKALTIVLAVIFFPQSHQLFNPGKNEVFSTGPVFNFSIKQKPDSRFWDPKKTTEEWSPGWMTLAQENIRKSEYNFRWDTQSTSYVTSNRNNNLRFNYTAKGFTVKPRMDNLTMPGPGDSPTAVKLNSPPSWQINFALDKKQVGKGNWVVAENQANYTTKKITVQYINNDTGMRQNFIVHQPLSTKGNLNVNFKIKTQLRTVLSADQVLFYQEKKHVLSYNQLQVWDATGKSLVASFKKKRGNSYSISVQDKDAVYPITIDPISTTPAALLESNQNNAAMGFSSSSAGDVNGDGYSDVVVGVIGYDDPEIDEGAAFVYHGSITGLSTTPAAILQCNQASARMGIAVATAGDVNGDGFSDIIVGAHLFDGGQTDEGRVFLYHGSASGLITAPAAILEQNQDLAQFGYSIACAGDINSDGFSDVVVGAWLFDDGETNEGVSFIYHGSAAGLNTTAATIIQENQAASNYGSSVAGAGDVNGDGYSDIIVGAENFNNGQTEEGVVFIYHGSAAGLNTVSVTMMESNYALSQFGFSVSTAGDVNGDGYSDVIVGAYLYNNGQNAEGAVFIYHGSATGINNTPALVIESNRVSDNLGISVACGGDINGDGYSDVLAGAPGFDNGHTNEGACFVYYGSAAGIIVPTTAVTLEAHQGNAQMGRSVASAGDVNGDGYSDVIAGATQYDNPQANEGVAFVYHGSAAGISATPNSICDDANQANGYLGFSVASAGNVNGDSYSDVIIGAFGYDNGAFIDEGWAFVYHGSATGLSATPNAILHDANETNAGYGTSVASAGDVNGDGYSDVIVGANKIDISGNLDVGKAFVYYGSPGGVVTTPAIVLSDVNQAYANFGISVASAGDINGDGYSDVIIGADGCDDPPYPGEGKAFIHLGSTTGLSAVASFVADDANQDNCRFGVSVASAGDVNGDGYSDIIVGANKFNDGANEDEGRAFVYTGSAAGLSASPAYILDDANIAFSYFGISVASAGDVNGDGYADVIVGAWGYDGIYLDEGRAFIYMGSATGLPNLPSTFLSPDVPQSYGYFGISVATAGDVNGDGYSDVIVGAFGYDDDFVDEGKAYIFSGSPAGLVNTPSSMPDDANQATSAFGMSVASAGDINGDGYSDVIVGAFRYNVAALNDDGGAFIYNGNEFTTNKRNNLRLYNSDMSTPLNKDNYPLANFGTGLYAKSFMGRARAKIVWETRLNFNPYSGMPITNSTAFTATQPAYTDLGLDGTELKTIVNKILWGGRYTKIRARLKYNPVTALTGQVWGPWRNVSSVIDGNQLGALPLDLLSFQASWLQKGKTARLSFTTDKENGICCFDIEKSTDGIHYNAIGNLAARNSPGVQQYSFMDENARQKNQYYRLKIIGSNGKVEYSNIQQLQYSGAAEILLFPNPTTDVLRLILNEPGEKLAVRIINSQGIVVKQLQVLAVNQNASIPVANLPSGTYWLHLQNESGKQVLQFIKQ